MDEVLEEEERTEEESAAAAVVCEVDDGDEGRDGAEVYSCEDWEVKRAPFRIPRQELPDNKLEAAARLTLLRAAGHRRRRGARESGKNALASCRTSGDSMSP